MLSQPGDTSWTDLAAGRSTRPLESVRDPARREAPGSSTRPRLASSPGSSGMSGTPNSRPRSIIFRRDSGNGETPNSMPRVRVSLFQGGAARLWFSSQMPIQGKSVLLPDVAERLLQPRREGDEPGVWPRDVHQVRGVRARHRRIVEHAAGRRCRRRAAALPASRTQPPVRGSRRCRTPPRALSSASPTRGTRSRRARGTADRA